MKNISEGSAKTMDQALELGVSRALCHPVEKTIPILAQEVDEFIRNVLAVDYMEHSDNPEIMAVLYSLERRLGSKKKDANLAGVAS